MRGTTMEEVRQWVSPSKNLPREFIYFILVV